MGGPRGHVAFDLDGTLVDSVGVITEVLNGMIRDRGRGPDLAREVVRPHVTFGGLAMIQALLGDDFGVPAEALAEFRRRYAAAPTPQDSLYPGAREALDALSGAGFCLSVVSNKPQELCEKVIADLGLIPVFTAVVGTGPATPVKPDPTGFHRALQLCGATRERTCLVGDSEADHALALEAEVPFVFATWGYGEALAAPAPFAVAHGLAEVPRLALDAMSRRTAAAPPDRPCGPSRVTVKG